jgi:hypothetical protein
MLKKLALFIPVIVLLGACSHPAPRQRELSFARYQPIYLDVANVDIDDDYESPMKPPNVEHLIPYSPMDAMHLWIKDRIRTVGTTKSVEIIIKDASVISTPVKDPGGMFPSFHNSNRYDAKLSVEMRIYASKQAMSLASIDVTATQSFTIDNKASLDERRVIFNKMIFSLMESMNAELEKHIYQYFVSYINYSRGV